MTLMQIVFALLVQLLWGYQFVAIKIGIAMIVVEHHAETVLSIVDKAYVLVNGAVAFAGEAGKLGEDHALQAKLLGVVHDEGSTSFAEELIA